ncbi:MAG: putative inorganic carbon transporter subunit DabA [Alphaproteobacteria bacterium]
MTTETKMIKPGHLPRLDPRTIDASLDRAIRAIPPLWPLSSSVAVNPFLGQAPETLAQASERLARIADVSLTMPRAWYRERMGAGAITQDDLAAAWSNAPPALRPSDLSALRQAIASDRPKSQPLPTVAQLAASISGQDWPRSGRGEISESGLPVISIMVRLWPAPQGKGAYAARRLLLRRTI